MLLFPSNWSADTRYLAFCNILEINKDIVLQNTFLFYVLQTLAIIAIGFGTIGILVLFDDSHKEKVGDPHKK